jgi:hypothetical protein
MYFIHVNIFQSTSLGDFIYFAGHQVNKQISIVRMVYCGVKVHYKVQTSVTSQLASHFKHLKAGGGGRGVKCHTWPYHLKNYDTYNHHLIKVI